MKEWWINLSIREKQTVILGSTAVIILMIYNLIWSPLHNTVITMRKQIQSNQQLLTWMQSADNRIQAIEKNLQTKSSAHPSGSLLSVVQNQINQSPIATNLSQLRQAENDSVQSSFKQVNFDKLIAWLSGSWQEHGLIVTQVTITPGNTPGMVSAELTLKSS